MTWQRGKREKEGSAEVGRNIQQQRWVVGNNGPGNIRHGLGLLYDPLRFPIRFRPRLASSRYARPDRWCFVVAGVALTAVLLLASLLLIALWQDPELFVLLPLALL